MRVFENRVLRNAFTPKGEVLREGWKTHVAGMYIFYCGIKENQMGEIRNPGKLQGKTTINGRTA
jgi:hypothetical protein